MAASGCASTLTLPSEGGPAWARYGVGDIEVSTDLDPKAAVAMTAEFDLRYRALASVSFKYARARQELPEVAVVVFGRARDYQEFAPRDVHRGARPAASS